MLPRLSHGQVWGLLGTILPVPFQSSSPAPAWGTRTVLMTVTTMMPHTYMYIHTRVHTQRQETARVKNKWSILGMQFTQPKSQGPVPSPLVLFGLGQFLLNKTEGP